MQVLEIKVKSMLKRCIFPFLTTFSVIFAMAPPRFDHQIWMRLFVNVVGHCSFDGGAVGTE